MHTGQYDLLLIDMPLSSSFSPPLGSAILKAEAVRAKISTKIIYASVSFTARMAEDYRIMDLVSKIHFMLTEVVFLPYAGFTDIYGEEDLFEKICEALPKKYDKDGNAYEISPEIKGLIRQLLDTCKRRASDIEDFLDELCDQILSCHPKIVGCTYIFQQRNASLAIMKRLKEKAPDVLTFMGGASVSADTAATLLTYMPQLDYAFIGDSDALFADAVTLLMQGKDEAAIEKYDCILKKGMTDAVPFTTRNLNETALPDFDDYFEALDIYGTKYRNLEFLPVEASRGCYYGKCRFCGIHLNDGCINYRKKDCTVFVRQLDELAGRYGIKKFFMTDCILPADYVHKLPRLLRGKSYTLLTDVRTNLTRQQLTGLAECGFVHLLPGIESLHDELLKIMDKGVRAIGQIEFLRNCKIAGISLLWNMMLGLPGEKKEWYQEMADYASKLFHLPPPTFDLLTYQKNSYFTRHNKEYGVEPKPDAVYYCTGQREEEFVYGVAETLYTERQFAAEIVDIVRELCLKWAGSNRKGATFTYQMEDGILSLHDSRPGALQEKEELKGLPARVCMLADHAVTCDHIMEALGDEFGVKEVRGAIKDMTDKSYMIEVGGEYLFLATPASDTV